MRASIPRLSTVVRRVFVDKLKWTTTVRMMTMTTVDARRGMTLVTWSGVMTSTGRWARRRQSPPSNVAVTPTRPASPDDPPPRPTRSGRCPSRRATHEAPLTLRRRRPAGRCRRAAWMIGVRRHSATALIARARRHGRRTASGDCDGGANWPAVSGRSPVRQRRGRSALPAARSICVRAAEWTASAAAASRERPVGGRRSHAPTPLPAGTFCRFRMSSIRTSGQPRPPRTRRPTGSRSRRCRRRCPNAGRLLLRRSRRRDRYLRSRAPGTRRASTTATRRIASSRRPTRRREQSCRRCPTRRVRRPAARRACAASPLARHVGCRSPKPTRDGRSSTSTSSKTKSERSDGNLRCLLLVVEKRYGRILFSRYSRRYANDNLEPSDYKFWVGNGKMADVDELWQRIVTVCLGSTLSGVQRSGEHVFALVSLPYSIGRFVCFEHLWLKFTQLRVFVAL